MTNQIDNDAMSTYVANAILIDQLSRRLPDHGDEVSKQRFLRDATPALINWMMHRRESAKVLDTADARRSCN